MLKDYSYSELTAVQQFVVLIITTLFGSAVLWFRGGKVKLGADGKPELATPPVTVISAEAAKIREDFEGILKEMNARFLNQLDQRDSGFKDLIKGLTTNLAALAAEYNELAQKIAVMQAIEKERQRVRDEAQRPRR